MKNKLFISLVSCAVLILSACEKKIDKIYYEGGNPPALNASTANVTLEPGLEANTALVLKWTNPDYTFTTGISSQDVSYILEMDTLGANFSSSIKYTTVIARDLSKTFSVDELNGILGNIMLLQLIPRRTYTLQLRVTSSISSAVKLVSNVVSFTAKPFAPPPKVPPPAGGHLYLVGDATPGAWNNPVPLPDQEFTKISSTLYQIVIPLTGGKHFLFLPVNGDWSNKYACHDKTTQPPTGGDFGYNGGNSYYNDDMVGPTVDGNYKITVDFQYGKYTIVKQ